MTKKPAILKLPNNDFIAYHKSKGDTNQPGVIFLGGLMSDMNGTKAVALEKFCKEKKYSFIRFDYIGHGESSGEFTDGTIGIWKDNAISVLDELTEGPQVLVGSSLGGWLMFLATLERKKRIVGLVGVASAPDFTEELIWNKLDDNAKEKLEEKGVYQLESDHGDAPYPITKELIEEGRNHLILNSNIHIDCPIRLLHGMLDEDVPSHLSIMLGEQLTTDNMCVNLIPNGDHRMSTPENIELLCNTLDEMIQSL